MGILDRLSGPSDLRRLDQEQLGWLAGEIREFLVQSVCQTGGHLGPNLGVVELTIALHRVFDSPRTPIVFDTGHQAYVHKLLTGRQSDFTGLRSAAGLSGYPNRAESEHDLVENSHASTALSYADGLSKAFSIDGQQRPVVAVIGDGALTGGLAWEALNNLGTAGRRVVVILNDNGRSYSQTVGGLPRHLNRVHDRAGYTSLVERLGGTDASPSPAAPESVFTELGFDYIGAVDGHDIGALETAFSHARERGRPVVVHCLTHKGQGYEPAEADLTDHLHTVGVVDVHTGRPPRSTQTTKPQTATWTDAFAEQLVALGDERADLVAVSAAMLGPTGLQRFADRFPDRCFDVGIAEQHAITSAAGIAMTGAHPVVALYATFANRAFDQILLDVGLHELPVTLVLDRSGITGPDGPSHHGIWDLSMLGTVPGMAVAAPRDAQSLAEELREAVHHDAGPTALRFPKSSLGPPIPVRERFGGLDLLYDGPRPQILVVAVGAMAGAAVAAAEELTAAGFGCTVVDPRWVLPVRPALAELAMGHRLVVTVEDGVRAGGVGSQVAQLLAGADMDVPVTNLGLPREYIPHGSRSELLARYGLDADGLARSVRAAATGRIATTSAWQRPKLRSVIG